MSDPVITTATPAPAAPIPPPGVVPPIVPPTTPPPPGADKWAMMARKEQQLRESEAATRQRASQVQQQERSLQTQQQALAARQQEIAAFERARDLARHDPMAYLRAGGIDGPQAVKFYQDYSAQIMTGKPIEVGPEAKTAALEFQLAEERKAREALEERINGRITGAEGQIRERLDAEEKEAQQQFTQALEHFAEANIERFPLVSSMGLTNTVEEVIGTHYQNTGRVMTEEAAFEMVERYYEIELKKTGKWTAAQKAAAVADAQQQQTQIATPASVAPTLRATTGVPSPLAPPPAPPHESDIERAIRVYNERHAENIASGRFKG